MHPTTTRRSTRRRWLTIAAVAGLFIMPAVLARIAGGWADNLGQTQVGTPVPAFTAQTLDGATVTVADLTGQVTVINFWATWCGPCRAEMPLLDAAHDPEAGVTVLAVNNAESQTTVTTFVETFGLGLPVLLDPDGAVQRLFGIVGYPTTLFVAPDGTIYAVHAGPLTADQLAATIAAGRG